jgi:hypothetical protein
MTETPQWGMELRSRIKNAEQARVFWGARALAKQDHRDFELDMDAQGFFILDNGPKIEEEKKLILIRALSVALESGQIIKNMRNSVHHYRYGKLKPRKDRPPKTFKHALRMIEEGKVTRDIAVRMWVDEEKPTLVPGGRKLHTIYEDESCIGYGDTLGSKEYIYILFFIKNHLIDLPAFGLGDLLLHDAGRVIVLGHVQEGGGVFYNVFLANGSVDGGRRIIKVPEDALEKPPDKNAETA